MIKKIAAAQFKAQCLHLMDEVKNKHTSIIITKRGVPIVKLSPIESSTINLFGALEGTVTITGDILEPIDEVWDADK